MKTIEQKMKESILLVKEYAKDCSNYVKIKDFAASLGVDGGNVLDAIEEELECSLYFITVNLENIFLYSNGVEKNDYDAKEELIGDASLTEYVGCDIMSMNLDVPFNWVKENLENYFPEVFEINEENNSIEIIIK
jgi:hypothetical protein